MAFHAFDLAFSTSRLGAGRIFLAVDQFPRAAVLEGRNAVAVVLRDPFGEVGGMADVEATCGEAAEDVGIEGHQESKTIEDDINYLKLKVDSGADFIVTQIFFDNKYYFDFVDKAKSIGINVPIIPGIMPVTNFQQIKRITSLCGSTIPENLHDILDPVKDDLNAVEDYGTEYAFQQCRELLSKGAPGIHFYTMNKSKATKVIMEKIRNNLL
jgi:hypothetical protein